MKTIQTKPITIEEIKNTIQKNINKQILIKEFNKQGKLLNRIEGTIIGAYNSIFLARTNIKGYFINKSFSYIDFLTKELFFEII